MANPETTYGYAVFDKSKKMTLNCNWKWVQVNNSDVFLFDKEELKVIKDSHPELWGIQPEYIKAGYWKDDGTVSITGKLENF